MILHEINQNPVFYVPPYKWKPPYDSIWFYMLVFCRVSLNEMLKMRTNWRSKSKRFRVEHGPWGNLARLRSFPSAIGSDQVRQSRLAPHESAFAPYHGCSTCTQGALAGLSSQCDLMTWCMFAWKAWKQAMFNCNMISDMCDIAIFKCQYYIYIRQEVKLNCIDLWWM